MPAPRGLGANPAWPASPGLQGTAKKIRACARAWHTVDHRLVIVGDAAHTVHPVAGQGVNLGWRDAQTLADVLTKAKRLGLDIGSKSLLEDYQRRRRLDTLSILATSDGMVRLFSNKSSILSFLRNTGLGIVNQIPPLKRRLMRRAMGL